MKHLYRVLFAAAILLAVSTVCSAQTESKATPDTKTTYYWYKGEKIPLIEQSAENSKAAVIESGKVKMLSDSECEKVKADMARGVRQQNTYILKSYLSPEGRELQSSPYLYIKLKDATDVDVLEKYAKIYALTNDGDEEDMPLWYTLHITPSSEKSALEISNELAETGDFASVSADFLNILYPCLSYDELTDQQWGLCDMDDQENGKDIQAPEAWNLATGRGVKVAIYDKPFLIRSGNHPDLADNISSTHYNVDTQREDTSYLFENSNNTHGMHCAGIAGAVRNNGIGISGVAPDCELVQISYNAIQSGSETVSDYAKGFRWGLNNVDVISCSWSSAYKSPLLDEAIYQAATKGRNGLGCIIVFSSGNDYANQINYPANLGDHLITVGALDKNGGRCDFSNYGTGLDVMAPGNFIATTSAKMSGGSCIFEYENETSGTSVAVPFVSGTVALMLEANPSLTATEVINILKHTTDTNYVEEEDPETYILHRDQYYGYGIINAYHAVKRVIEFKNK